MMGGKHLYRAVQALFPFAVLLAGCDATIHEYPESGQLSRVIVELNVDRTPPAFYKELEYDADGNHSEALLEPVPSARYLIDDAFDMRFVVELYRVPDVSADVDKGILAARREVSVDRLMEPPQDTLHFYVPDGSYKVLAWADYVPKGQMDDWHFDTEALDNVRVKIRHKPVDNHQKNSAAGLTGFSVDFSRDKEGTPMVAGQTRGEREDRLIPVYMKRPAGRFRLWTTDLQEFLQSGRRVEDLRIKLVYKQYISAGYDVNTQEPNVFVSTRTMETRPGHVEADGTLLLAYDYVLTSDEKEDHVLVDVVVYDADGQTEINHYQDIEVPLRRNQETVLRGPFLTRKVGSGVGIDDDFDGEHIVEIR